MNEDQAAHLTYERAIETMTDALRAIKGNHDCYGWDDGREASEPCGCPPCAAERALEAAKNWRFTTSYQGMLRRRFNTREQKIIEAWQKQATGSPGADGDRLLAQVLYQEESPTVRDWYVATTVIQWLATNVGMGVLEGAGFKYVEWDQDRAKEDAARDAKDEPDPVLRLGIVMPTVPQPANPDRPMPTGIYAVTNRRHQVVTTGTREQLTAFAQALLDALKEL